MAVRNSLLAAIALCATVVTSGACISGNELQVTEHHIVVQEYTGDTTQSSALVRGTARNTGRWNIRDCRVSVSFYDYKGNVLGVLTDSKPLLSPSESWSFRIELKGKDAWNVARYSLTTSNK